MRRRTFIAGVVSTTATWPLAGRAQQSEQMRRVGFLRSVSLADAADLVTAFRQGLKETGYIEGQNVAIELRSAEGHLDRLPALVADLIRRPVAVIVGNHNAAVAAKATTTTIPIIFATGSDPVRDGIVASLNRPGGNITGVTQMSEEVAPKRLELLHELLPKASVLALLVNPTDPAISEPQAREVLSAARALGVELHVLNASTEHDFDAVFAKLIELRQGDSWSAATRSLPAITNSSRR